MNKEKRIDGLTFKGTGFTAEIINDRGGGTSIFDPVLCELAYRWFCPQGGTVLDPFAGGSVRGIVAAVLGRQYIGVDLSQEQIEANRKQWDEIATQQVSDAPWENIKISTKWIKHKFSCSRDYITSTCRGRCCEGSDKILISLLPEEAQAHIEQGFQVVDGLLQPDSQTKKCPHKREDGLCGIHGTSLKPFGCIASPFTLNNRNTLIIRNRYSMMKCHGQGYPAHKTFRASLDLIFGANEAERICNEVDAGVGSFTAHMPEKSYRALRYLDGLKHGAQSAGEAQPVWHCGDSRNIDKICEGAQVDFVFSCPPYADLEVYSDDPNDLSTLDYDDFIVQYADIIKKTMSLLKDNRFACFVVGEVRNKRGNYYCFVPDTIRAFEDAGAKFYNEAILVTAVGSLPIRVGRQFEAGRKLGKTHQNVLIFCKGDSKKATQAIGPVEFGEIQEE